ncbi:MAG: sulfite exporter TauE/SafE family protein [Actinobacteria bacterium]|nr:sulfite exporter TauE/SafE family protein [Actinomycetota bacterium]
MLGSISPVGEASRNQRWWLTATAHVVGSATAGAAVGLVLGGVGALALGSVSSGARLTALGVVTIVAAAVDARSSGRAIPGWRRQVDERWLSSYRGWVYGAAYGAQLGAAVTTIVPSASTYAALAAALATASWRAGLVIGAAFGLARTTPLLAMAGVRTVDRLYAVTRRVADAEPWAHRLTIGAQGVLAAAALVTALVR